MKWCRLSRMLDRMEDRDMNVMKSAPRKEGAMGINWKAAASILGKLLVVSLTAGVLQEYTGHRLDVTIDWLRIGVFFGWAWADFKALRG